MFKHLARLFHFLLPIIRQASLEVLADTANRMAYPVGRRPYRYTSYSRLDEPTLRQATMNVGRSVREASAAKQRAAEAINKDHERFHDVLMIAFDITGPSQVLAQEFLANYLPDEGEHTYHGNKFNLDSWWVADDNAHGDLDSAVFVTKGKQEEARKLLREHGLVE